jgi:hypothetical protein
MITMHQFLEAQAITGDTMPASDNPLDAPVTGARHYRVNLRRDGRTFETYVSRPPGTEAPALGDALAQVARRVADVESDNPTAGAAGSPIAIERTAEAARLRQFLGVPVVQELIFEFGHRPASQIDEGDPVGNPARPEEMTNQEPAALRDAAEKAQPTFRVPVLVAVLPSVSLAAGALLFARRNYRASALSLAVGVTTSVAGAQAARWWASHRQAGAQEQELGRLSDERSAIQVGA